MIRQAGTACLFFHFILSSNTIDHAQLIMPKI